MVYRGFLGYYILHNNFLYFIYITNGRGISFVCVYLKHILYYVDNYRSFCSQENMKYAYRTKLYTSWVLFNFNTKICFNGLVHFKMLYETIWGIFIVAPVAVLL